MRGRSIGPWAVALVVSSLVMVPASPAAAVPSALITSPADGEVTASSLAVTYNVADAESTSCLVDGAPTPCTPEGGPVYLSGLTDGTHTFELRALSGTGEAADSVTWTVDASPPVVQLTQTPAVHSTDPDAAFAFDVTDSSLVVSIDCTLDGVQSNCGSGSKGQVQFPGLADGAHHFEVRATDFVGNTGSPVSYDWAINYPWVDITLAPPLDTFDTTATFAYTIGPPVEPATPTCFLDSAPVGCGQTGQAFTDLDEGLHAFTVKVVDNGIEASDSHEWYVDLTKPTLAFTFGPGSLTNATSASFGLSWDDARAVTSVLCSLDDGPAQPCTENPEYFDLTEGLHTLSATATDAAGNATTVSPYWTVDVTEPEVELTAPTSAFTLAGKVPVTWTGSDEHDVELFQLDWRAAGPGGGFGAWQSLTAAPEPGSTWSPGLAAGSTYCFRVTAYDVPNTEAVSELRCTSSPLDDRGLKASAGWTRGTGSAFYRHTHSSATAHGRTLTRSGVVAKRVGVVVTRCRGCGKVAVFWGSSQIGTVNLASTTTRHRQIVLLPAFATLRSGTVKLKVISSSRLVRVDGLVLLR